MGNISTRITQNKNGNFLHELSSYIYSRQFNLVIVFSPMVFPSHVCTFWVWKKPLITLSCNHWLNFDFFYELSSYVYSTSLCKPMVTVVCKIVHKFASVWCKTALGEVGVSLPWWSAALVLLAPGYWSLFLDLKNWFIMEKWPLSIFP